MISDEIGRLTASPRGYHWLFVWVLIATIWSFGIIRRGATAEIWIVLALATAVFFYLFFIDISHKVWWSADKVWCRQWDYLAVKPNYQVVRINELTEVTAVNHPGNFVPGKPFDRFLLTSPTDTIIIFPSFHRREELEKLLHLIHEKRPTAFSDPQVLEFMDGGFSEWWRHR